MLSGVAVYQLTEILWVVCCSAVLEVVYVCADRVLGNKQQQRCRQQFGSTLLLARRVHRHLMLLQSCTFYVTNLVMKHV
jgi:hypothetical protein